MAVLLSTTCLLLTLLKALVTVECSRLPDGYVEYPEDNTAHRISDDEATWAEARERCLAEGADLVVAFTPEKVSHITKNAKFPDIKGVYTGVYRPFATSPWIRVDTGKHTGRPGVDGARCSIGPPGPPGLDGRRGRVGAPGPAGPGYNATWFALLAACQEQGRGQGISVDGRPTSGRDSLVEQKCEAFIAEASEQMRVSFQNFVAPEVQEFTAKTCQDLFVAHPDTPSGEYWIDPNGDRASDKILVYCDAETGETCISPAINRSLIIRNEEEEEKEVWLSEHVVGIQIRYTVHDHQINALQFLSKHAEQKVTYHCSNSVAYFDAEGQTYERGLKLSAWNGVELKPRGRRSLRYDVISDECQNRSDEWQDTVIAYRTSRPVLLPILDVALRDLGGPGKRGIIEIGDVCFS